MIRKSEDLPGERLRPLRGIAGWQPPLRIKKLGAILKSLRLKDFFIEKSNARRTA
jgi:hypothetical protein